MSKATSIRPAQNRQSPGWLPLVLTLGLYGLPRLRPRWKYTASAVAIFAAWLGAGVWFALANPGLEPLVAPIIFAAAIATLLRLTRP
jgi:hypothetical protein